MGNSLSSEPVPSAIHDNYEPGDQRFAGSRMDEISNQSLENAKKFRKPCVTILTEILNEKARLNDALVKENNAILKEFLDTFIAEMKEHDPLFKKLFQRIHYTGSYYSDLRVSTPDEYDLNLVLKFPFKPNTVSEIQILRRLHSDCFKCSSKYYYKEMTITKGTSDGDQEIKCKKRQSSRRRKRPYRKLQFACKSTHDSYENTANGNTLEDIGSTKYQTNINNNNKMTYNEKFQFIRSRRRNFQKKYPECKNVNNTNNNLDENISTQVVEKNINFQTIDTKNTIQGINNKKVKYVKFRKRTFHKKYPLKNTEDLHGSVDNICGQKFKRNVSCLNKNTRSNLDLKHKKIKFVNLAKKNFQRKHYECKNISNSNHSEVTPKAQEIINFCEKISTIPDALVQDKKCKNDNVSKNNQDLNSKKIQVSKRRKRNRRRKNFSNKSSKSLSSNHIKSGEILNQFSLNTHPNGEEFKIQATNQSYIQYHSQVPSYAKYSTTDQESIKENGLTKFFKDGYLIPDQVRTWLQSVVDKTLITYKCDKLPKHVIDIKTSGSGPARTIILRKRNGVIDIDLVPAIECCMNLKPPGIHGKVYEKLKDKLQCFLVPKPYQPNPNKQLPINAAERARLWRMHYPVAEDSMLHDLGCVKPVIKLLKLLRDKENWKILASYYLKTIVMWMVFENSNSDYWKIDRIGERFKDALISLADAVKEKKICYFFSSRYNLLEKLTDAQADNIYNRLRAIIKDIENDPQNLWKIFNCPPKFTY